MYSKRAEVVIDVAGFAAVFPHFFSSDLQLREAPHLQSKA